MLRTRLCIVNGFRRLRSIEVFTLEGVLFWIFTVAQSNTILFRVDKK